MARQPLDSDRVLDAAADLADAEGIDAVTLTRVAKTLGVHQPALYRHVDGYNDMIRSLGLRGRELIAERLSQAAIGVAGEEAVASVARAWRDLARERPGLYAATDRSPCAGDAELEAAVERIVEIIARAISSFDLSAEERVHAARNLRSAFHGFSHLETGDGHPGSHDRDDTFEHLIELLCAGLHNLESTSARSAGAGR